MQIAQYLVSNGRMYVCVPVRVHSGLKSTAAAFFLFTLTVTLVAYTATAMTMAISADQSVVALANIFMTITFVFMMVRDAATQKNTETHINVFQIHTVYCLFTSSVLALLILTGFYLIC